MAKKHDVKPCCYLFWPTLNSNDIQAKCRRGDMVALHLDRMTWPEISEQIRSGRGTVVVPFGSTEQHGGHLPLGTDSVLGDEVGWGLAERLNAFLAPTLRFGCSEHHLAFAGTISLAEDTFRKVVRDVIRSLCKHGFQRIVLLPTHGGNFAPLRQAFAEVGPIEGVKILAFTDLDGLMRTAFHSSGKFGIDPVKSGAHAGEWETSVMLCLRTELVNMEQAAEGFLGSVSEVMSKIGSGLENLDQNGVLGDPRTGNAEAGKIYLKDMVDFLHQWVLDQDNS
jgi:creatinine amidohydrolase